MKMIYKRKKYKKRNVGVPAGYKHIWGYKGVWKETKLPRGKGWKVDFKATKRRTHKGMGSFGKGTKIVWGIKGKQYAQKTGRDTYQTRLIARKYPLKIKVRKPYKAHNKYYKKH
jgi:hypothetical protein